MCRSMWLDWHVRLAAISAAHNRFIIRELGRPLNRPTLEPPLQPRQRPPAQLIAMLRILKFTEFSIEGRLDSSLSMYQTMRTLAANLQVWVREMHERVKPNPI